MQLHNVEKIGDLASRNRDGILPTSDAIRRLVDSRACASIVVNHTDILRRRRASSAAILSNPNEPNLGERLRAQTLARFFTPARITAFKKAAECDEPGPATLSSATHLTGLTQIGPLRLNCDRSFVSLLDTSTQYIIAEATRTISLSQSDRYATPQDRLFLGVQALHKSYGVCPNTVQVFTDPTGASDINTSQIVANATRYVIRDFRDLDEYKDKPYVTGFPRMRSYAEVPMRTSSGSLIGSYCVVDTDLRDDFFSDDTIFVLGEIASSIVDYLELLTVRYDQERSARLLEGLSLFAEGRTPSDDSDAHEEPIPDMEPRCDRDMSALPPYRNLNSPVSSLSQSNSGRSASTDSRPEEHHTPITNPDDDQTFEAAFVEATPNEPEEQTMPSLYSSAFSRAAKLIREAMDMDGVAFLDAPYQESSEAVRQSMSRRSFDEASPVSPKFGDDTFSDKHLDGSNDIPLSTADSPLCQSLGSSIATGGTTEACSSSRLPMNLHEESLRYLTRVYPNGHIFSSDEYGVLSLSCNESVINPLDPSEHDGQPRNIRDLPHELQEFFRAARSVIFLPMWNFSKEQFFAGLLGWSLDSTRVFQKEDFTCLSAFGNAVMTELARIEALDVARAKSDFISSISHELRSPLHGVLASAEMLADSIVDDSQIELIRMIESCGTTLLETLNHLLDHSRINKFDNSKGHVQNPSQLPKEDIYGQESEEDLSEILESVVEGVYFGQTSKDLVSRSLAKRNNSNPRVERPLLSRAYSREYNSSQPRNSSDGHVAVLVNVENRADWRMPLRIGAWKRVIMNLFANALKYTHSGHIEVSLQMLPGSSAETEGQLNAHLTFSDTGVGIGPGYLKHQLFKPFTQEDALVSGTGLGLNIVKQIVSSLGGTIEVRSKVAVGTRIEVVIPVPASPTAGEDTTKVSKMASVLDPDERLQGKTLCIVPTAAPTSSLDGRQPDEAGFSNEKTSPAILTQVVRLATEYLGMKVCSSRCIDQCDADFYFTDGATVDKLLIQQQDHTAGLNLHKIIALQPEVPDSEREEHGLTELVYPIGPRTFTKALHKALKAVDRHELPSRRGSAAPQQTGNSGINANDRPLENDSTSPGSAQSSKHLLLVDDNPINLRILGSYLKKLGCTVATAVNGQDAVTQFKTSNRSFDLVFMDISMPVMNGFEASRVIRDLERQRAVPGALATRIIALTGLGSAASRKEAASSGIDEFRTKPVPMKEVKIILNSL